VASLSDRLKVMAEMIDQSAQSVADIGTDHGLLPIYLIENRNIQKIIATDLHHGPLEKARENLAQKRLQHYVELRRGDGLQVIRPGEVEVMVMAGMGGVLISQLLQQAPRVAEKTTQLLFQPMTAAYSVRKFLLTHGYQISREKLVEERHQVYEIIEARFINQPQLASETALELGLYIASQPSKLALPFLEEKKVYWQRKRAGLLKAKKRNEAQLQETANMLEAIEEVCLWHQQ